VPWDIAALYPTGGDNEIETDALKKL